LMNTEVPEMLPDPAVMVPETVYVVDTEPGVTDTVTASPKELLEAATAIGESTRNARSIPVAIVVRVFMMVTALETEGRCGSC